MRMLHLAYEKAPYGCSLSIFLTIIAFSPMKYLFRILCVVFISQYNHYGKFTALYKLISIFFAVDESNRVKISCVIMRCQGYFHKIVLGTRLNISYYSVLTYFNFFFQSKKISYISNQPVFNCFIFFVTDLFSFIRFERFLIY